MAGREQQDQEQAHIDDNDQEQVNDDNQEEEENNDNVDLMAQFQQQLAQSTQLIIIIIS